MKTMKIIDKKIWPDMFETDRDASLDFRLADFELNEGDCIRFREWNPKTKKYTGREYLKKVKQVTRCSNPARYWRPEEMDKHGMYLIEWEE